MCVLANLAKQRLLEPKEFDFKYSSQENKIIGNHSDI